MLKRIVLGLISSVLLTSAAFSQGISGSYLAARSANIANDYEDAARYYRRVMFGDPGNGFIMQGAMVASVAVANYRDAAQAATMMAQAGFEDKYAQALLVAKAFAEEDFAEAKILLNDERFDINPLIDALVNGWILVSEGDLAAASQVFSNSGENTAIQAFANYHNALALALAGEFAQAEAILSADGAYVNRGSILAHAELLAILDRREDALNLMMSGAGRAVQDRQADLLRRMLRDGDAIDFSIIQRPADAVSEVFLVLADALEGEGSDRLGLFFGRLAQLNQPDNTQALLLVANILTQQNQLELAIEAYGKISSTDPFFVNSKIGQSAVLQQLGDFDAAIELLENLVKSHPGDLGSWHALGDVLRGQQLFEESYAAYTNAIELLPDPDLPGAWRLYYSRAISAERNQDWPDADWNFRQALALNPDQPDVLNYLGYSLVERQENLEEALEMIQTAVAARPDSGFIVDSLGWIFYRLGRFEEAVPIMENAVALLPVDAVVNDHLGDVLWKVGREREARFQWRRALSFDPEEVDAARIRLKLAQGLDAVLEAEASGQSD